MAGNLCARSSSENVPEACTDVSAMKQKKRTSKKNPKGKKEVVPQYRRFYQLMALLNSVSLPYPGSSYTLWRIKKHVKQDLGEEVSFKCKKRHSTIYGDANLLEPVLTRTSGK